MPEHLESDKPVRGTLKSFAPRPCGRARTTSAPHRFAIAYPRTLASSEVAFVLGNAEVAVVAEPTDRPSANHRKGLLTWREEHPALRYLRVCRSPRPRRMEDWIEVSP